MAQIPDSQKRVGFRAEYEHPKNGWSRCSGNERVQVKVDWARLRFFAPFVVFGLPIEYAAISFTDRIIPSNCPPDTFVYGSLEPFALIVGVVGLPIAIAGLIASQLKYLKWFRNSGEESGDHLIPPYAYVAAMLVMAGAAMLGAVSRYCAADSGIIYSDPANSVSKTYAWRDVSALTTSCYYTHTRNRGGHWEQKFLATMSDGNSVSLMGADMASVYPRIVTALKGRNYAFHAQIGAGCEYDHMEFLTTPPR